MDQQKKSSWLSRATVPLLVALFVAPMVAAWIVYNYFPDVVRSFGTTNYGEFVMPPVEVKLPAMNDVEGNTITSEIFDKNWTYVYLANGDCLDTCLEYLMLIKNVRLTQGKEISRLKRLFIVSGKINDQLRSKLSEFPGMTTLEIMDVNTAKQLFASFKLDEQMDPLKAGNVYVVDPDSKLMMYYKPDQEILKLGKGMQKDMSKLMFNSVLRK